MLVMTTSTKTYIGLDGSLEKLPLSAKFGEIELREIYRLAEMKQWESEPLESRIDRALSMVDGGRANPKAQCLLDLARRSQIDRLDGIECWTTQIDETRAAGICLDPIARTLEVMVIDTQWFTPIHRERVTTRSRLCELVGSDCSDSELGSRS
jgi:hypothetical protein